MGLARGWHSVSAEDLDAADSCFDRRIIVPFCYQSKHSGIGDTSFHDIIWYARTFDPPTGAEDERLLLPFEAIFQIVSLGNSVNGAAKGIDSVPSISWRPAA